MSKEKVIDISTRKTGKIVGICAAAVAAIIVVVSSRVHSSGRLYGRCDDLRQGIRHCTQRRIASESAFCTACNNSVKQDTSLSG